MKLVDDDNRAVCFSGHRPEKLPYNGDVSNQNIKMLLSILYLEISQCIDMGYRTFYIGMSRGIDLWAGIYLVSQKNLIPSIKIISAIPYKNYAEKFKGVDKWNYNVILENAEKIVFLSEKYYSGCMKARNEYMIKNSEKLIAVVNEYKSGTGQTIGLARKNKLDIKIINPFDIAKEREASV